VAVVLVAAGVFAQPPAPVGVPVDAAVFGGPPAGGEGGYDPAAGSFADVPGSPYYRWWVTGEYFLGFTRDARLPVVATTGTAASQGVLGRAGTQVLLGGEQDFGGISGARFGGGLWLDPCRAYAVEWGVFFLPTQRNTVTAGPGTAEAIARPFFDTALNVENARLVSLTGLFEGTLSAQFSSLFWGAELGSAVRVFETSTFSFEQLFHFRYYTLEESLRIDDTSRGLAGGTVFFNGQPQLDAARVSVTDFYSTINRWYGGTAGMRINWTPGRWAVGLEGRMGVGAVQQKVTIDGSTTLSGVGPVQRVGPGVLTAGSVNAVFNRYKLSLAPEFGVKVAYHLTDHLAVTGGYHFLYITDVARPGEQVQRNVNPTRIPSGQNFGAAGPAPAVVEPRDTDFLMHGLSIGLMFKF
jgi:hypothetical protein